MPLRLELLEIRPQDFEALTPNLLARTMETVEGGGIVVLLLSHLSSLRDLYTLTMDMHSRLRTPAHEEVKGQPPNSLLCRRLAEAASNARQRHHTFARARCTTGFLM